ncbi:peroxiredoxin [Hydrogenovibrio marinus]|uniref:thioredoxin-dependent peroxiredoxin n=1 Tax=Hydrogenovibrio marinus TaxID=28885 RepID=A0A067A0V4_HYDMR|nr:peroxiredoxin [Hydrogenovibrio marinus]KDN96221.1 alkyl hydroperoxide reductase [Hydrogenovibrio marinus]BBN60598.1 peroxiredoxin [Hydrogenovibrio marinus]
MLQTGDKAPAFSSQNHHGQTVSLSDFQGKNLVLYFYPKDDTPGCTIEANEFTALANEFSAANTVVLGVSKDDCASHQAFIDKFDLTIDLLADTSGELCEAYGVWQLKEKNGVSKMGIVRSTFIADANGKLVSVEYGVNPEGHAQAVLETVKGL